MRSDLEVRGGLVIPGDELRESASRAGGPGGQHVNKASTRVTLRWNVTRSNALTAPQRSRLRAFLRPLGNFELVADAILHDAVKYVVVPGGMGALHNLGQLLVVGLRFSTHGACWLLPAVQWSPSRPMP